MLSYLQYIRESRGYISDEQHRFHDMIGDRYPHGLYAYHESPGHVKSSILRHGIQGQGDGVYATIGNPSNFVSSNKKTVVLFKLPPHRNTPDFIAPDMRYDPSNPHHDLLSQHPNLDAADIYINHDLHPRHIVHVNEI